MDGTVIRVEHGDGLEVIPQLVAEGVLVDAIVTDPPYHLSEPPHVASGGFGGSRSDERRAARAGFMGKAWDGGDIAFRPETWAACYGVLKPGGYLLAFGGERTFHRMWCAIEDAGFVLQTTLCWLWGSGFPKHKSDLKPSWNPIALAYKPGGKRELQIDDSRVGDFINVTPPGTDRYNQKLFELGYRPNSYQGTSRSGEASGERRYTERGATDFAAKPGRRGGASTGRWPANVCHDGSDEVMEAFAAFHTADHGSFPADKTKSFRGGPRKQTGVRIDLLDQGSPARFYYAAKASKADRAGSKHPTVKPIALMRWLVRLVTPPNGTVLDPFAGSGTTAAAVIGEGRNAILIEREDEYIGDISRRLAVSRGEGGHSMVAKNWNRQEVRGPLL